MKSLWFGYLIGLVWCVIALVFLVLIAYFLPTVDLPWNIMMMAATAAVLGVSMIITCARAITQPVPSKKEVGNDFYPLALVLFILAAFFLSLIPVFFRYSINAHRAAKLFDPLEATQVLQSRTLLLQDESYTFSQVELADVENGSKDHVKMGWVMLAQQGNGILRITDVNPSNPDLPIGMELPVSAPFEKPNWNGRVRIGQPSLGSPTYYDPATLEARFTNQLNPTSVTTIKGVLVLPVIVPNTIWGPDVEGWVDVSDMALTVCSEPVAVTVIPTYLAEALSIYRNNPLEARFWVLPILLLYDLALVWVQRRGRKKEQLTLLAQSV